MKKRFSSGVRSIEGSKSTLVGVGQQSRGQQSRGQTGRFLLISVNPWCLNSRETSRLSPSSPKDAAAFGKWAGRAAKVYAAYSAYERYQKCRGD